MSDIVAADVNAAVVLVLVWVVVSDTAAVDVDAVVVLVLA